MKYTGTVMILDDQGESVFERELTADEMVEVLITDKELDRSLDEALSAEEDDEMPAKRAYRKKRAPPIPSPKVPRGQPKPCCGSKGVRHKKGCTGVAQKNGERKLFSESTYNTVKDLCNIGISSMQIAAEKGLDSDEIRKVRLSSNYDQYFRS